MKILSALLRERREIWTGFYCRLSVYFGPWPRNIVWLFLPPLLMLVILWLNFCVLFRRPSPPLAIALGQIVQFWCVIALIRATISSLNKKKGTLTDGPMKLAAIDSLYAGIVCLPAIPLIIIGYVFFNLLSDVQCNVFNLLLRSPILLISIIFNSIFIFQVTYIYLKACLRFTWVKYILPPFIVFWQTFTTITYSMEFVEAGKAKNIFLYYLFKFGNPMNSIIALYRWAILRWENFPLSESASLVVWILILLIVTDCVFRISKEHPST